MSIDKIDQEVKEKYSKWKYILPRALESRFHSTDMPDFAASVNSYDPKFVIDCGCGFNYWKGKIQNLVGFDSTDYGNNDLVCNFTEADNFFAKESADIVLVLGSINTSNKEHIEHNLNLAISWVKPGGYIVMRTRSDFDTLMKDLPTGGENNFIWNAFAIKEYTDKYNLVFHKPVELRYEIVETLSESDLENYQEIMRPGSESFDVITREVERRKNSIKADKLTMIKPKYCWWWQKR